ncbi:SDR family oxidoreductase [Plebeiibacterium sediminum]|jgi:NADP-dependent 3-hydroxy acid dehydrogenase YdfG|uniref:SDR family oxidoreductase n=2 Tax=Bacteroidia TaxID=200643 RepID=A0AAE3M9A0_9BACT|nr:SDR family oxidoreductase [Plebeiobacterium sediminum]MCW3789413.1 SDR family oxidoreductase [Plebeiobacterium sediminum]
MKKELIVITGASAGIGLATAKQFAKLGHPLLLLARRVKPMQALNLENTICMSLDVTDRKAFEDAVRLAESQFGAVGAIVNNAGIMLLGNIVSQDPKEWDAMLDVNIKGLLNGVHAVAESMVKRNSGTIINISSIAGIKTFPNHTAYVGTKFAVSGLSENLREEMAPHNVRVITIEPGAVDTTLLSHTTDESIKENYNIWKEDMGGVLSVEDVSNAIIYAYNQPQNVCIREIVIAATKQLS